jgi:hypothetical protein
MLVGGRSADRRGRAKDAWTQHAAAAAIDNGRIHRPVDRGFFRERLHVNAGNEYGRNNCKTSHGLLLELAIVVCRISGRAWRL